MRRLFLILLCLAATSAHADFADVIRVEATATGNGHYRFDVTVRHADEGWDHFANKWDIIGPDGTVIATRVLYHPHVSEQPFTRSLPDVSIPEGITAVSIRAHDSVHGYGGREISVELPR